MPRASMLLLLGGAALLVTWLVSPASSSPDPRGPWQSPPVQSPSATSALDIEVEALHDHETAAPPAYQLPSRDPFSFSARAMAPAASLRPSVPMVAPPALPPLPKLVAILSSASSVSTTNAGETAALSYGEDVQFAHAGDMSGKWLVRSVSPTAAVLVDSGSGTSVTLLLQ